MVTKVAVVSVCGHHHREALHDSRTFTFRGHDARDPRRIDAAVADGWCWGAEAEGEALAEDGLCSTQSVAEYQRV